MNCLYINKDWSTLKKLLALKAAGGGSVPQTETATGSLVTFNTTKALPLIECVAGIEPVQDLHGYDNPWPAGGGENLFDIEKATLSSGAYGFSVSRDGDKITVSGIATSSGNLSFAITTTYADDSLSGKGYICQVFDWTGNKTFGSCWGFRTENERAFAISVNDVAVGDNVNVSFKISVAETSQSAYSPYSNICPISGWTGAKVYHSGEGTSNPTVLDITFPSEAGTVYGGTLDVVNGVLTVDRAQIASYNGETLPGEWISDRDVYAAGTTPSIGAQVVYEIAAPITYQLTPQEITTLIGTNNMWADTGDITVKYYK